MIEMTTERAIEVLSQYFTHRHNPDVIQQALDKAIEVMEQNKECQHPYHLVHTTCMGEINKCLARGEEL